MSTAISSLYEYYWQSEKFSTASHSMLMSVYVFVHLRAIKPKLAVFVHMSV